MNNLMEKVLRRRPQLPTDGWQLNGKGPKIHPIGDDSEQFIAFGTWPSDQFCGTLLGLMHHLGHFMGTPAEDEIPQPDEVEYIKVSFIPDYENSYDWGVNWGDDSNGRRNIAATVWRMA